MSEIDWRRYPAVAESECGRRWLQIQCNLDLAQNTVEAYGRGLEEYLEFLGESGTEPVNASREIIARYVHRLRTRPGAVRGNVVSIDRTQHSRMPLCNSASPLFDSSMIASLRKEYVKRTRSDEAAILRAKPLAQYGKIVGFSVTISCRGFRASKNGKPFLLWFRRSTLECV